MRNNNLKKNKFGISLIVLIITIIVVILLSTAVILGLAKNNPMDSAKKAKFMANFTNVEEGVTIYATSKLTEDNIDYVLPISDKVSLTEKASIKKDIPTLQAKIEELSGESIDNVDLYHIDATLIGAENLYSQKTKGYLIDAKTRQVYDYEGEFFGGLRWHTLDAGVGDVKVEPEPEMWDGWIKLTLYYPPSSTERMWRLSSDGETRTDTNLSWENYTGPITVPLNRIQDVWIKYKVNGTTVVVPPLGTALVDIEPDTTVKNVSNVKVNIAYDADATVKEYKVGDGGWKTYTGEFIVAENVLIEARVVKPDNIYDDSGNLVQQRNVQNSDSYYINNVKQPVMTTNNGLVAPTIERLDPVDTSEVAKVRVTYPVDSVTKEYIIDYGVSQNYTNDISVTAYGTYIMAYYYDANGVKSPAAGILIDETPTQPTYTDLPTPTINNLGASNLSEITSLSVTYPTEAVTRVYTINGGAEISYTGNISVTAYRTYVKAYYYDVNGRMSDYDWIYINSTGESTDRTGGGTPPPTYVTPSEPTIELTPSTVTTSTQVSIKVPEDASKIYISLGNGAYQVYTIPITVTSNMDVRAYYITYDGKKSYTAYRRISNIRMQGPTGVTMPYVGIIVTPQTNSLISKSTVTLNSADATTVEYSYDNVVFTPYTAAFDVTQNCTIYARAKNENGIATDQASITNIGTTPPQPKINLAVSISATPEPSATTVLTDKVKISIEYDANATSKYYMIGQNGTLIPYTGEFDVNQNCTIYAYAVSANGRGTDTKIIDNIVDGISDPVITSNPNNNIQASKDKISIAYDKNATIKQYRIGNGQLRDYVSEFEVAQNCTIYAYSENVKGQSSKSTYLVTNISAPPTVITIDYGKYFLLKLNYPPESSTKEYKWKESGTWKTYNEEGILLIKPEYKDEILDATGKIIVKIKDENGVENTFTGDYYLLDVGPSEIRENVFMRWDRVSPNAPEIVPDTTEPAKEVNVTINYESYLIKKQYKVVDKDGTIIKDWTDYAGPIKVTSNNTTIYAKGQDEAEAWSSEASKKITNIDEQQPDITLTLDTITVHQNVPVRISVTDDVAVGKVKWASGIQANSYFLTGGTEIANNSILKITSNGYYTFYAEDKAGNTQIYTLNITNVDVIPPAIVIDVTPDTTVGTSVQISIDYGDSTVKQYKIGESNATWLNYTGTITLSSYTVLSNNWKNTDGTVTIYAKGTDSVGNVKTETNKIVNLDLDIPTKPVINSNAGYPVLTSFGVTINAATTIAYDSRTDIDNYYSTDNGATWKIYNGSFNYPSGTIIAKSIKKDTGLEISATKTVAMPSNALGSNSYDGNESTYVYNNGNTLYMNVDSSIWEKNIEILWKKHLYATIIFQFIDQTGTVLGGINYGSGGLNGTDGQLIRTTLNVPIGTTRIKYYSTEYNGDPNTLLYEIQLMNEPTFTATNGYMLLHADTAKKIQKPYQMVTISYFPTSVQRLYSTDNGATWLEYQDQPIWINQGSKILAKGIDKDGKATRKISSYTANTTNALGTAAYDGNESTYIFNNGGTLYMNVDPSLWGKNIEILWKKHLYMTFRFQFVDESGTILGGVNYGNGGYNGTDGQLIRSALNIPTGTTKIKYYATQYNGDPNTLLYEIKIMDEPIFTATNCYMLLHADSSKAIKQPYQMVAITYFTTSTKRLYSLDNGVTWLNYQDKPIWLNQGSKILAKGIDQYGNATRKVSSYTANSTNAIGSAAYDNNESTYVFNNGNTLYMSIDSSVWGKSIQVVWKKHLYMTFLFQFIDQNGNVLGGVNYGNGGYNKTDGQIIRTTFVIPTGTTKIKYYATQYNGDPNTLLYEIKPIGF